MASAEKAHEALLAELEALRRANAELSRALAEQRRGESPVSDEDDPLPALRSPERAETLGQLREAKRRAEAATRAKSQFLANVSHELRTPMTAILGFADLLLEEGDLRLAPKHRIDYLRTIKRNGQHLMRILSDILDFSKIEAGKVEIERVPTPVAQVVADLESLMRVKAAEKGVQFEVACSGALPASVDTDPTRLRQILVNLVGNAIKFTDRGGVRVLVQLTRSTAEPRLRFSVSDTGPGLAPEALERIFEGFSQADASTTRQHGGSGLGLTISRELARLLGGSIDVASLEGHGSTFTLELPVGCLEGVLLVEPVDGRLELPEPDEGETTLAFLERVRQRTPGGTILLVEDGRDNARLIQHTLERCGFEVHWVEDGEQGVARALEAEAKDQPYALVLMDMQMPVMDGHEAARELRSRGCSRPIVALTAHAMQEDRQRCLDAGCDAFETKPIDRRQLVRTVLRLVGQAEP